MHSGEILFLVVVFLVVVGDLLGENQAAQSLHPALPSEGAHDLRAPVGRRDPVLLDEGDERSGADA